MNSGRINSPQSIANGARVFDAYGRSWLAVERAARRDEDGRLVVRMPPRSASAKTSDPA